MGSFTADGQLQSQSWPDGSRQDFAWEKGRLKQISLPDQSRIALGAYQWLMPGQIELPAGARITQKPDAFQRLAQLQVTGAKPQGAGANAAQLLQRRYSRNPAGHITRIESEEGASAYTYDRLGRLTQAEPDQALQDKGLPNEAYSWDAAGNRLSSAHQAGAWTYNEANQLLQYPRALDENAPAQQSQTEQVSASYNALGHLIKETGAGWERNWRYNAAGRLSEIKDSADGLTVQYRYDPFGRRIAKTVTQGATSRTTYYINGESALMAEADEEGRITRAYGFNPHTQQARTNEEDEDAEEGSLWSTDPIWRAELAAGQSLKEASYHYLVTDHLGVPVLALNKAGETTWKANYEAFGKARINPASTAPINLRLPGQYFDAETGLHQNWNRDYAPGIGRYVQADPIGLAGGLNVYQYAYNDPLVYIDPSGEIPVAPIIWGYLRCVARCTARATAWDALTGEIDCWPDTLQDNVKGCAMSCANPLNWFGKGFILKAQNNKQKRNRIKGLEEQIRKHEEKMKLEPVAQPMNHWKKELRDWYAEIERIKKRLPGGK